ncbi:hypothetical protein [Streptomyces specialis]|uniref:hypothetical protein n=1 Tax=Streptomyces specialis TaxID=498367 RepID=UPI00073F2974|nr:hypothetical protein [Streptomyces specialis]
MRPRRFQQYALDAYRAAGLAAEEWSEKTKRPFGIKVRLASGAELWHAITTQPREGDRHDEPEQPVEKQAPDPLPVPDLGTGRIKVTDLEPYLAALLTNAGSPEIVRCRGYSDGREQSPTVPGVRVDFWSGARAFLPFVNVARSGQSRGQDYDLPREI